MDGRYTTLVKVREEAGLTGNTNIADSIVQIYQDAAEDEIDGVLLKRYSLPLSEVPSDLATMATLLAAGLLLLKEYGPEAEGTTKDGQMKVDTARDWLKRIADGSQLLIGADSAELGQSSSLRIDGLPIDEDDDEAKFKIDEKF